MSTFDRVRLRALEMMRDMLVFKYTDWDDMIECEGVYEQEIRDALAKLEVKIK